MKKINTLAILILLVLGSCNISEKDHQDSVKEKQMELKQTAYWKVSIDNCQYIVCAQTSNVFIHAGDCSNPNHNNVFARDYQLDVKDSICTLYSGDKEVGKFNVTGTKLEDIILKDNQ